MPMTRLDYMPIVSTAPFDETYLNPPPGGFSAVVHYLLDRKKNGESETILNRRCLRLGLTKSQGQVKLLSSESLSILSAIFSASIS